MAKEPKNVIKQIRKATKKKFYAEVAQIDLSHAKRIFSIRRMTGFS